MVEDGVDDRVVYLSYTALHWMWLLGNVVEQRQRVWLKQAAGSGRLTDGPSREVLVITLQPRPGKSRQAREARWQRASRRRAGEKGCKEERAEVLLGVMRKIESRCV